MICPVSSHRAREVERQPPRRPVKFGVGLVLTVSGLVCLALSAFVDSWIVNALSLNLISGGPLVVYGWRGSDVHPSKASILCAPEVQHARSRTSSKPANDDDRRPALINDHASSQVRLLERVTGIEPAWPAWKAGALPLSYTRVTCTNAVAVTGSRLSIASSWPGRARANRLGDHCACTTCAAGQRTTRRVIVAELDGATVELPE